jgi:hypothetical protein
MIRNNNCHFIYLFIMNLDLDFINIKGKYFIKKILHFKDDLYLILDLK